MHWNRLIVFSALFLFPDCVLTASGTETSPTNAILDQSSDVFALIYPERVKARVTACVSPPAADNEIPQTALANFERFDPLEMSGRFIYFTHQFPGMGIPVHVCLFDSWRSGSSFLGCTVSNDIPRAVGCAIQDCSWWEWYRLGRTTGETNLVVVAMRRWGDGSEDAGYDKEQFVTVFEIENGIIRKDDSVSGIAELVADSSFSCLERPRWYAAKRSTDGEWSSGAVSNAGYRFEISTGASVPDGERIAMLASFLNDRTNAPPIAASNVVFESDMGRTPFFALVSDGTDATEDGCLWIPFLWNGTEWTESPTNGFACASGRCPASFRAATNEFYRLTLSGELPRLVVLKNRNGNLRETFWETALGPEAALLDFEKGMPDTGYLVGSGFPSAPRSVLQSLAHLGRLFPFMRLERIVPEQLPLVPSEPL